MLLLPFIGRIGRYARTTIRDCILTGGVGMSNFAEKDMGFKKTPSEVYAEAWGKYRTRCRRDGLIALNQYCRSIGIKEQRLYEWLRLRLLLQHHRPKCRMPSEHPKQNTQSHSQNRI